jgi:hypothetical protein
MSIVYNEMLQKKQQMEKLAQQGKRKYEYDSDEDVDVRKELKCIFDSIYLVEQYSPKSI